MDFLQTASVTKSNYSSSIVKNNTSYLVEYENYSMKIYQYRENYFDRIFEKYDKKEPDDDIVVDIKTLKVVGNIGKRKIPKFGALHKDYVKQRIPKFGTLSRDYYSKSARKLASKVEKLVITGIESTKHGNKKKIADVSTVIPNESSKVHSMLTRNKQKKHDNLAQELDINVDSKKKSVSSTVENLTPNKSYEDISSNDVSRYYQNIPLDDFLLSSKRLSTECTDNIKIAKSKNDINDSLCNSMKLLQNLEINQPSKNMSAQGKLPQSYKNLHKQKLNDTHKCTKLDAINRDDFRVDSTPSSETQKSFDVCSAEKIHKKPSAEGKLSPISKNLHKQKLKNDSHKCKKFDSIDREDFSVDSTPSSETENFFNAFNEYSVKKIHKKSSAKRNLFPSYKNLHKQKLKIDTHKYKKLDSIDREDFSVDSKPSSETHNETEKSFNALDVYYVGKTPKKSSEGKLSSSCRNFCKQNLKNDTHKCKKLDAVDREDFSDDSTPSSEADNEKEKSFNALGVHGVTNVFGKCIVLLNKLDITNVDQRSIVPKSDITKCVVADLDGAPLSKSFDGKEKSSVATFCDEILDFNNVSNDDTRMNVADEKIQEESIFLDETLCFNSVPNDATKVDFADERAKEKVTSQIETMCFTHTSSSEGINDSANSFLPVTDSNISLKEYNKNESLNTLNMQYKQTSNINCNNPNMLEKHNLSQGLHISVSYKKGSILCVGNKTSNRFKYKGTLVRDSFKYDNIPEDVCILSCRKRLKEHNEIAESKNNNYSLCDSECSYRNMENYEQTNSLKLNYSFPIDSLFLSKSYNGYKKSINFNNKCLPPENISSEVNLSQSCRSLRKRKSMNDTHKWKKLLAVDKKRF